MTLSDGSAAHSRIRAQKSEPEEELRPLDFFCISKKCNWCHKGGNDMDFFMN